MAETTAKEANRTASSFASVFVTQMSPNLPPDAGPALQELTKAHLALMTDKKNEAQRENDLIYNAILPAPETLPQIDKAVVATPITIQEVYASPEVQKVIGQDMFVRLIPLSVHESASVYSEEKAKLVRGEVENADAAEVQVKSALEAMGIKEGLTRFKAISEGGVGGEAELPTEVRRWKEDIAIMEERESVESIISELSRMKDTVKHELETISHDLDVESRECESMRVKYDHLWTQTPSSALTKSLRQDLKSHLSALEAAAQSDQQVVRLWESVRGEIQLLLSPQVEDVFRASTESGGAGSENLLDLDVVSETKDDQERVKIGQFVDEIEERLGRLNKISHERSQVLKDLKDKVRTSIQDIPNGSLTLCDRYNKTTYHICFCSTAATLAWKVRCSPENLRSSDPTSNDWLPLSTTSNSRCKNSPSCGAVSAIWPGAARARSSGRSASDARRTLSAGSPAHETCTWKCGTALRKCLRYPGKFIADPTTAKDCSFTPSSLSSRAL